MEAPPSDVVGFTLFMPIVPDTIVLGLVASAVVRGFTVLIRLLDRFCSFVIADAP